MGIFEVLSQVRDLVKSVFRLACKMMARFIKGARIWMGPSSGTDEMGCGCWRKLDGFGIGIGRLSLIVCSDEFSLYLLVRVIWLILCHSM